MKKLLIAFLLTSAVALGTASCTPAAMPGNPNASASPGNGSGQDANFSNKAALIAYMECIKIKVPSVAPAIDAQISVINGVSEADFAASVGTYKAFLDAYKAFGC